MQNPLNMPRVRMIIAGGFSLISSYLVFLGLLFLGVHYLVASVANFLTYLVINFILNKHWSFKSRGNTKRQAIAHTSLHLGNQILIMIGLWLLVEIFMIPPAFSQIIMQVLVTILVFVLTPIIFKQS